jgi:hypothetical protein
VYIKGIGEVSYKFIDHVIVRASARQSNQRERRMSLLLWITTQLDRVPATFWGVLAGSFFTLVGTALTNYHNSRRLETQIESDRRAKRLERQLTLKREVFMNAIDAIMAGLRALGNVVNAEKSQDDLMAEFTAKSSALSKLQVVASMPTLRAVQSFTLKLFQAMMVLGYARKNLLAAKASKGVCDIAAESARNDVQMILEKQKEINRQGKIDKDEWEQLQRQFEFTLRFSEGANERVRLAGQTETQAVCELARNVIPWMRELNNLYVPAAVAIRKELEFDEDFDAQGFASLVAQAADNALIVLETLIAMAEKMGTSEKPSIESL